VNPSETVRGRVDLHCHSSASNGATGKPADMARTFKRLGFSAFALAEHDTFLSQEAAAAGAAEAGIEFVPGVEVSTRVADPRLGGQAYAHILGYYFKRTDELEAMVGRAYRGLEANLRKGLERLRAQGIADISEAELSAYIRAEWGADDLWKKPFNCPMPLGQMLQKRGLGLPGEHNDACRTAARVLELTYPPAESATWPDVRETCDTLHRAGAVVVLAHPASLEREALLRWLDGYVDGIEVYHPRNSPAYRAMLLDVVRETGCAFTGGSDLHWMGWDNLQALLSDAPYACVESLKAHAALRMTGG
jgi:predicted metal-dependent phosphoesterase TrpH